jgi:hypothetical protein
MLSAGSMFQDPEVLLENRRENTLIDIARDKALTAAQKTALEQLALNAATLGEISEVNEQVSNIAWANRYARGGTSSKADLEGFKEFVLTRINNSNLSSVDKAKLKFKIDKAYTFNDVQLAEETLNRLINR